MKFSTVVGIPLYDAPQSQQRIASIDVIYRGTTSNNVATELFLDGTVAGVGRRLVPDRNSAGVITGSTVAYNATTGVVFTTSHYVSYFVSAAGVITIQNNASVVTGAAATPAALVNQLGTSVGADNAVAIDVVAASGAVPAFLRLQVRGTGTNTVYWESNLRVLEATSTGS